jgi:hypothetical protein
MKASIFGALLALTVTTANAAEDTNSANRMLPGSLTKGTTRQALMLERAYQE